ncbi:hypothetical protein PA598K_01432 [Paenibacillus sp. 598K]|uniref:hypothetical protein n=1 Tax=Paenibacillus sp. 598K TaxID=1117987 RepID=UPI000FFAB3C1|nr:hypothetical protein [Paenibacillus sp. 598K]GBF73147.1 hypothetical protein PA598K_01432 [Paenibacillus sp. 598K]
MTDQLRAVAIGPDRVDIVVGHGTDEELAAWYYAEINLHEDERTDYHVSEYPLDTKLEWEEVGDMTLRQLVADCPEFPCIAGWED